MVYPVLLGTRETLFGRLNDQVSLHLLHHRTLGNHLTSIAFEIVRPG